MSLFPRLVAQRTASYIAALVGLAAAARVDDWIELRTPNFVVLSEASEGRTRDWATEFELFRRGMSMIVPVDAKTIEPVTLVIFRSDRRLRPFKPLEHGKPSQIAGYFARAPGRNFIAISIEGARDDVREIVFHEGVHWHLSAAPRALPLWFEEGVAEMFGNFHLSGSTFVVGSLRPEFMRYVKVAKPIPFAELMAVAPGGLSYNSHHGDQAALFYQEAWVMVHALFMGTDGPGIGALTRYATQPPMDRDPMRDFELEIGKNAAAMDRLLAEYVDHGRFRSLTMPFDRSEVQAGFHLGAPAAGVMDLTLGNLLLSADREAEAEPYLARASAALSGDPRADEALATMHIALGNEHEAAEDLRWAAKHGSTVYFVYYLLGELALHEAHTIFFDKPDVSEATTHLVHCLQLNPRFVPACESLSLATAFLTGPDKAVDDLVRAATVRYPRNAAIQLGLASVEFRHGEIARAREALQRMRGADGSLDQRVAAAAKVLSDDIERQAGRRSILESGGAAALPPR